ncbi:MAG: hypothetical protein AAGF23_21650, partial [Acidobacteriota bacterium]
MNGTGEALAVFDDGGGAALYVGGDFSTAGGVDADHIARWDGTTWSALGDGVDDTVFALAVYDDGTGPALYAGGRFRNAGGAAASGVARWDGSTWSPLGGGTSTAQVFALGVYDGGAGPALFVGGDFDDAGGVTVNNIARWDGASWSALGGAGAEGVNGAVRALAEFDGGPAGSALYVGGSLASAGGQTAARLVRWDGASWSSPPGGAAAPEGPVFALGLFDFGDGERLVTGSFAGSPGSGTGRFLTSFDGTGWID